MLKPYQTGHLNIDYPWFTRINNTVARKIYLKKVQQIEALISEIESDTTLDETYKTNLLVNTGLRLNSIIDQISRLQQRQIQTLEAQQLQLENIQNQNRTRISSLTKRTLEDDDTDGDSDGDAMEIDGLIESMQKVNLNDKKMRLQEFPDDDD